MAKKSTKNAETEGQNGSGKSTRHRSPNYPSMNLAVAVQKLPKLFESMKRHPVGVAVAVGAMDYSYNSSTGKLALAAMRAFGLFENVTTGKEATVKLSTRALDIANDYPRESAEWWRAVKAAALDPHVHSQLWEKYGASLPADDELRRYLVRELKFNDNAVDAFIQEYKDTISFAKLAESDIIDEDEEDEGDEGDEEDDEKRRKSRLKRKRKMSTGVKEDVYTLDEGDVVLQWPEQISQTSADDLDDWLKLIVRKIKRSAGEAPPSGDGDEEYDEE